MNIRSGAGLLALSTSAAIVLGLVWAHPGVRRAPRPPGLAIHPAQLVADGYDTAMLEIDAGPAVPPHIWFQENPHGASVQEIAFPSHRWQARIRAGVMPGRIVVHVEVAGLPAATAQLTTTLDTADAAGDGTPDFLRLDDEQDQRAFRSWFTFLAEAQYFQRPEARPAEIVDCAALIRYAYREALRAHDSRWAAEARLPLLPGFESVGKYQYPFTALGAALFRVRPGQFQARDLSSGAFAQFADAETLWRLNTYRAGRNLAQALPGDLLFFRQDAEHMPFHSMIYVGRSRITKDVYRYLVYHTGPDGADPGTIRRLTAEDLMHYPEPQWRPVESNPQFLGVYRWNLLRMP